MADKTEELSPEISDKQKESLSQDLEKLSPELQSALKSVGDALAEIVEMDENPRASKVLQCYFESVGRDLGKDREKIDIDDPEVPTKLERIKKLLRKITKIESNILGRFEGESGEEKIDAGLSDSHSKLQEVSNKTKVELNSLIEQIKKGLLQEEAYKLMEKEFIPWNLENVKVYYDEILSARLMVVDDYENQLRSYLKYIKTGKWKEERVYLEEWELGELLLFTAEHSSRISNYKGEVPGELRETIKKLQMKMERLTALLADIYDDTKKAKEERINNLLFPALQEEYKKPFVDKYVDFVNEWTDVLVKNRFWLVDITNDESSVSVQDVTRCVKRIGYILSEALADREALQRLHSEDYRSEYPELESLYKASCLLEEEITSVKEVVGEASKYVDEDIDLKFDMKQKES